MKKRICEIIGRGPRRQRFVPGAVRVVDAVTKDLAAQSEKKSSTKKKKNK